MASYIEQLSICSLYTIIYLLLWKVQNSITEVSTFNDGTAEVTTGENRSSEHGICEIGFIQDLMIKPTVS